jgi:cobalt-zinc-cadmium efflux system outer membrane protein
MPKPWKFLFLLVAIGLFAGPVPAAQRYDLKALLDLASEHHRALQAGRDTMAMARAGIATAAALPNPEIEYTAGTQRARVAGGTDGRAQGAWLSQRIEYPSQRRARVAGAEAGSAAAEADFDALVSEVMAEVKRRYYDVWRRKAEFAAMGEDLALLEQIRKRVAVKVESGEAARYELIKADAELLNAQKSMHSARLRVSQAKAMLRQAVGAVLEGDFDLVDESAAGERPIVVPVLDRLLPELAERNPELRRLRAQLEQADRQLDYERSLRLPALTLKGGREEDVDTRSTRIGVVVAVPIFDRRRGPVDAAAAQAARARHELENREAALRLSLEAALRQYEIAALQVQALESGILRQASEALRVAEAAYRFGERGILDYLDAQRVFRSVRNDLIAARFELRIAVIEIERLLAGNHIHFSKSS